MEKKQEQTVSEGYLSENPYVPSDSGWRDNEYRTHHRLSHRSRPVLQARSVENMGTLGQRPAGECKNDIICTGTLPDIDFSGMFRSATGKNQKTI